MDDPQSQSSPQHEIAPTEAVAIEAPAKATIGPVVEQARIASIDVLRGVAVLGILVLNIRSFSMPSAAYDNPTAYGDLSGANFWVWFLGQVLGDQKFMTIFSMLFGAGIVLMTSKIEARGKSSVALHYRRMMWLAIFGILHAYLLWYGDILFMYGICGMLVYPLRKWRPRTLIIVGLIAIALASAISLARGYQILHESTAQINANVSNFWQPSAAELQEEIDGTRGSFIEGVVYRAPISYFFQTYTLLFWGIWRAGGLMLMGMGLFKLGVFSAKRSPRFYCILIALGVGVGIPIVLYGIGRDFVDQWRFAESFYINSQFNYWASILVSLAWVGAVELMCRTGALRTVQATLAAAGRMALTNYLMQTVICTFIFYGFGLGQFGKVERVGQMLIVMMIWILQLITSRLWLRYFQFGPFEWLWRSLTYWKVQPVRRGRAAELTTPVA